jgi:hypothetical protein
MGTILKAGVHEWRQRVAQVTWKSVPMKYPNGVTIKVGDTVRFEQGGATGTVEAIIDDDFANWSVDEPGVMLLSAPFGRVFIPESMFISEEVAPA